MSKNVATILLAAACGAGLALAYTTAAAAQSQQQQNSKPRSTPDNFSWDYGPGGKIVRKARVTKTENGERKETPKGGKCVSVEERTPDGVKRVDEC